MNWFLLIAYIAMFLILVITFILVWVTFAMVYELSIKFKLISLPEDEENLPEIEGEKK